MNIHQQMEASRTANGMLAISCCLPGSDLGCEMMFYESKIIETTAAVDKEIYSTLSCHIMRKTRKKLFFGKLSLW